MTKVGGTITVLNYKTECVKHYLVVNLRHLLCESIKEVTRT